MANFSAGEWPVSYVGAGCSVFNDSGAPQAEFEEMAANLLWSWTGRIFGVVTETIRPVRVQTPWRPTTWEGMGPAASYAELGGLNGYGWLPVRLVDGSYASIRCGTCGSVACQCDPDTAYAIHLPGPVQGTPAVSIDGAVLDPANYRLDYQHTLIRYDAPWPTAQDLLKRLDDPGTWSIEFQHGVPVPVGGQIAAGVLACELYKSVIADPTCGLPSRVQSVTRQGVSMEVVQTTFKEIGEGRTGLWPVDSWVASVNTPRDYVGIASPDTLRAGGWASERPGIGAGFKH